MMQIPHHYSLGLYNYAKPDDGTLIGPSMMLRVMAGDKVAVNTQAFYTLSNQPEDDKSSVTTEQMAGALLTALSGGGLYNTLNEGGEAPVLP